MKNYQLLILPIISFIVSGCSSITVTNDYDPAVSFSGLQTYNWISEAPAKTGDPRIDDNTLLQNRVKEAIDKQMTLKGYQKATSAEANFWITYHVTLDKKTNIRTINTYNRYGSGWGWGYGRNYGAYSRYSRNNTSVYTYDEGSLIIDIVEPNSKTLIWRGSATDEVNFSRSPEQKEQKINEAVEKILEQFPPQ